MPHPGKHIDNKSRMKYEELNEYFKEIDEAKEKYQEEISIKKEWNVNISKILGGFMMS